MRSLEIAKDLVQIIFWLGGTALSIVSIVSVVQAIRQYRLNTRQRIAQSLIDLEERFELYRDILPLIDPASKRYEPELRRAVEASLNEVPQELRQYSDRQLILRLDQLLRFLLLLSSLEKYQLLNRESLEYMYRYWFGAIYDNEHLMMYVRKYFKTLDRWLENWIKLNPELTKESDN